MVASSHEPKGVIWSANQTVRMNSNRLRAANHRTRPDELVLEATYRKKLIRRSKLASQFELLYGVQPRISEDLDSLLSPPVQVSTDLTNLACDCVNLMLCKQPREMWILNFVPHVPAYFWTDGEGWPDFAKNPQRDQAREHFLSQWPSIKLIV